MITHSKIGEVVALNLGVYNADISTTDRVGTYFDASKYKQVRAKLFTGNTVAQTKGVFIQLLQAKDASGTDAKELTSATTEIAPTGGSLLEAETSAYVNELDSANGFTHIAVKVGGDGTSTIGFAVVELADPSYAPVG